MRKRNTLIISLFALLALISCGGNESETAKTEGLRIIDVDNPANTDNPPISQLIDTAFVVKFQGEDLLIKDVYGLLKSGDRIFLHDTEDDGPIKVFDDKGNFIRSIHKGNGPGEVSHISDMFFDEKRQALFVSNYQFWSLFDRNGNYLEQIPIPFQFGQMSRLGDEYAFFAYDFMTNDTVNSKVFVTDTAFNLKYKFFPLKSEEIQVHTVFANVIYSIGNEIIISNDTVYTYANGGKMTPQFSYKCSNLYDPTVVPNMSSDGIKGFMPGATLENSRTALFPLSTFDSSEVKYTLIDRKSGNYYVYSYVGGKEVLRDNVPPFIRRVRSICEDYFVSPISEYTIKFFPEIEPLLSESDKKNLNDFQPDDNPMMLFFKYKEF